MRLPRMTTRRWLLVVAAVGLVTYVGLVMESRRLACWDGGFLLQVNLTGRTGAIVAVAAQTCQTDEAEILMAHPDHPELNLARVPWVRGQPFTIDVRCSGVSSRFRNLLYSQDETLLLRLDNADGASRFVSVAIPDGRVRRSVTVAIP